MGSHSIWPVEQCPRNPQLFLLLWVCAIEVIVTLLQMNRTAEIIYFFCCLLSHSYIAKNMDPDQTATLGAVIVFASIIESLV